MISISREKIIFLTLLMLLTMAFYFSMPTEMVSEQTAAKTMTVSPKGTNSVLFFSGTVKPLQIYSVTSPIESVINKKKFEYGQYIKKDDVLFILNSSQLRQDYQNALAEYLKAKEHYNINLTQNEGLEELNRLGIISKNEYTTTKSNFNDAALAYSQARQKLYDILQKVQGSQDSISKLKLENYDAVNKALTAGVKDMDIKSPANGVALIPEKSSSGSGDDNNGKLDVGSQIKNGQRLLTIGDMTGIAVEIKVNEVDINRIKTGQDVMVTGTGFPDMQLQGKVNSIDSQAVGEGNALPTFPVKVIVPNLTEEQRKIIHVGMSAKVELHLQQPTAMMVPIRAVTQRNGKTYIKVRDARTGQTRDVEVTTGQTTPTSVEIKNGLQPGDNIVIAN